MKLLRIAAVALLVAAAPAVAQVAGTACKATAKTFNSLQTGMTVSEVEKLIGCTGSVLSESDIAGFRTIMLQWDGQGMLGANMNALFQNGTLQMKSQFGLR